MQVHDRGGEEIELPSGAPTLNASDFLSPSGEALALKGLVLAEPFSHRARRVVLPAIALVASFGLGWAGGQVWPELQSALGISAAAQKEAPSPRPAKAASAGRHTSNSKPSLAAAPQAPPSANASVNYGPVIAAAVARISSEATGTVSPANQSMNASPPAAAALGPLAPAPDTKPTTIPGWIVTDVREGTAVLDGPYGPRMARRGDTISGIGRVESIVRWGNRWIVATSNGLIASP